MNKPIEEVTDLEFELRRNADQWYKSSANTNRLYAELREADDAFDLLCFSDGFKYGRGMMPATDSEGNTKRVQQQEWVRVSISKRDENVPELVRICNELREEKGYNIIPCVAGYEIGKDTTPKGELKYVDGKLTRVDEAQKTTAPNILQTLLGYAQRLGLYKR